MTWLTKKYSTFLNSLSPKRVLFFLFAIGLAVYVNSFINDMFWDDYDSVINNQYIRSWQYFPKYFSENLTAGAGIHDNYWRPLLLFSFSVDYGVGGTETFFYHFQNFFWHLAASMLVFLVGLKLSKKLLTGFLASLFFLVHPLQTEAVTYVAGRADPMHTALMLGSFFLFLHHLESRKISFLNWSLLLFVLSILTKERAIVLPFILTAFLFLIPLKTYMQTWKQKFLLLSPYLAIVAIYALLRMTILHFANTFDFGAQTILASVTLWQKIIVFLAGLGTYVKLIIWPDNLYMEKILPIPTSLFSPLVLLGIVSLAFSIFLIWQSFKKNKLIAFCLLSFFATLLPSMYVYPIQGLLYEHWLYPAFPWLFLTIAISLSKYLDIEKPTKTVPPVYFALILLAVISAFSVRTIGRNQDWQNPIRFYEKNISLGGFSGRVYTNLGMAYDDAHLPDMAILAYQKAIDISGNTLFQPWYDMANTLAQLGKTNKAIEAYNQAIRLNPNFSPAYTNLAKIYADKKDFTQAIAVLQDAEKINPHQISILYAMAAISFNSGDTNTSRIYAQKILELDPTNKQAQELLRK
ncbi:MAG: tetratricopeptide repeat protein [Candidatus Moraniibacteriota bacterium]